MNETRPPAQPPAQHPRAQAQVVEADPPERRRGHVVAEARQVGRRAEEHLYVPAEQPGRRGQQPRPEAGQQQAARQREADQQQQQHQRPDHHVQQRRQEAEQVEVVGQDRRRGQPDRHREQQVAADVEPDVVEHRRPLGRLRVGQEVAPRPEDAVQLRVDADHGPDGDERELETGAEELLRLVDEDEERRAGQRAERVAAPLQQWRGQHEAEHPGRADGRDVEAREQDVEPDQPDGQRRPQPHRHPHRGEQE